MISFTTVIIGRLSRRGNTRRLRAVKGKTIFITGATRGIGHAIALRAAREGANVAIAAKTVDNDGKLKGTIHDAARAVEEAGGRALPLQVDVRDDSRIIEAIEETVNHFGGIDMLVNNAGAIKLQACEKIPPKRWDLIHSVNLRAPFVAARACIPHMRKSDNPHILNISPPIDLDPGWFKNQTPYTISKYGQSMLTIGLSGELRADGIAVNSLWPKTTIATAATNWLGGGQMLKQSRTPDIMADAAHAILSKPAKEITGGFFLDEAVLRKEGVSDFSSYAVEPGNPLLPDLYIS
jgi:citronellol/citronellal dehydrogenase